uniref:Matrix metalloproteinase-15-like n=1 Tax=Sinocyclocheilus anshuiensis TaxID=1608454 RepID=A0A671N8C9_9TELE
MFLQPLVNIRWCVRMCLWMFTSVLILLQHLVNSPTFSVCSLKSWLRTYGYLSQASRQMSTMQSAQILSNAVKDMQRFYGLEVTGHMDLATLNAMKRPRCGVPDHFEESTERGTRRKRYALTGHKWDQDKLTYSIQNHSPKVGQEQTYEAIHKAFQVWEKVTPLRFEEVPYHEIKNGSEGPDIILLFASGYHGDMSLFDGEGGSLAHAFFPGPGMGGDTHFDIDEPWTLNQQEGSAMQPLPFKSFHLMWLFVHSLFVFCITPAGSKYWLFREADVEAGYPQDLFRYGQGMPDRVDTAVWWEPSGYTYFFRGDRYWQFSEESRAVDKDYPKPVSMWGSIPGSPKGAFLSDDGAYTYFYKDTKYWRFDNKRMKVDAGYPRSILNDFMGCRVHFDAETDVKPDHRSPETNDKNQDPDNEENTEDGIDDEEDEKKEVDVILRGNETDEHIMTLILVTVPLVLVLCILGVIYIIITTLQRKEMPKVLVHCKRSLQQWV